MNEIFFLCLSSKWVPHNQVSWSSFESLVYFFFINGAKRYVAKTEVIHAKYVMSRTFSALATAPCIKSLTDLV